MEIPASYRPATTYEALATLTWDIDLWGRIKRQIESPKAELFATVQASGGWVICAECMTH